MDQGILRLARRILGVGAEASPEAIRRAARCAARRTHPDLGGSARDLQRVLRAREVLLAALE